MTVVPTDLGRETSRLKLPPLRLGDENSVLALLSDDRVVRYMLFPIFDEARAHSFVARMSQPTSAATATQQAVLGITRTPDGDLVGLCGFVLNRELEEGEAWYLLRPELWGHGLITEAVKALVDIGFGDLRLHRIWASCLPANPASARVLEKLGFRREGLLRQNLQIRGTWQDSYLYAVLSSDWPAGRPQA